MGPPISITSDFSSETVEPEEVAQYFSNTERNELSAVNLYLVKIPFRNEGEIKTLTRKSRIICHQQAYP